MSSPAKPVSMTGPVFESRIGEPNSSSMPSRSSVSSMTIPRRMACDLSQVGSDHNAAAERPQAARERNALVAARRGTPWGQVLRCNAAGNAWASGLAERLGSGLALQHPATPTKRNVALQDLTPRVRAEPPRAVGAYVGMQDLTPRAVDAARSSGLSA